MFSGNFSRLFCFYQRAVRCLQAAGIDRMVVLSFLVDCADPPPDQARRRHYAMPPRRAKVSVLEEA